MKEIYLDNNATTPVAPEVFDAMTPYLKERFGNPSSLHAKGVEAARAVGESRKEIARYFGVKDKEIIFTSGATESINMAIQGAARANKRRGTHIVTTLVEHDAVLETCAALGDEGFSVTYLPTDAYGRVTPEEVRGALQGETILVAIMHVNNELGTVYPINEIGRVVKEHNSEIIMFSDGAQAFGKIPMERQNIDLYAASAHKIHGPKGVGALYVRDGIQLKTLLHGGGQEKGMRSGTENVAGIVGFAKAARLAHENMGEHEEHMRALRTRFLEGLSDIKNTRVNSPEDGLFTTANVSFLGIPGREMVQFLGELSIYASIGSACKASREERSHVIEALPIEEERKLSAVRFGFSRYNTEDEIARVVAALKKRVEEAQGVQEAEEASKELKTF